MYKKVKHLATIQIGYQFRSKIQPDSNGTHRVIQIKNFDDDDKLDFKNLDRVVIDKTPDKYIVQQGDVLFLSRGPRNFAYAIATPVQETIAASYFFILRLDPHQINPAYFAWYINQTPAQSYLANLARRGSHMPMIPRSAFEQLHIEIPSLETQRSIVELDRLHHKERCLMDQIIEKRSALIETVSLKAIKNEIGS